MSIKLDSISIVGLRATHFEQLMTYVNECEKEGFYYGNKKQWDKRHEEIKNWLDSVIKIVKNPNIKIPKK